MTEARRRFTREFKLYVLSEIEGDRSLSDVARVHGIHPSMLSRWRDEIAEEKS